MPARLQGADGTTHLLVLPSDGPSSRQEALTAVAALEQLLSDPAGAAHRAAAWREQLLLQSSSAALLGMTAGYAPQQHARQLRRADAGQAAAGSRSSSSSSSPLAGPAWLAGCGSTIGCASSGHLGVPLATGSSCGTPPSPVHAVRSSSSFLHQSTSPSRSGSPLPPLVLPRVPSRLGGTAPPAAAAAAVAEGQTDGAPADSSLRALPSAAMLGSAKRTRTATALPAQLPPPLPQQPAPPAQQDHAWEAYCRSSVAAALAVCMAEAVRQVEVGCAERGRLLAQLWNHYTATLGAAVRQQQAHIDELLVANANLSAGKQGRRRLCCCFPGCSTGAVASVRLQLVHCCSPIVRPSHVPSPARPARRGIPAAMGGQQSGVPSQGDQPPAQGESQLGGRGLLRWTLGGLDSF